MPHRRNDTLTASGLSHLLAKLHAEPEQAGLEYERLRALLIKFFDWRGSWPSDECADETLDRLGRKLAESTEVADLRRYALGVARHVWLERRRQAPPASGDRDPDTLGAAPSAEADSDEAEQACLDQCLLAMPEESRSLVLRYYEGERHAKIVNRQRLAASLSLSDTALRSRVQRLRNQLEACVRACVSSSKP